MNRSIDNLGRLVIPKEMRDKLNLKNGDEVTIKLENDKIVIMNPTKEDKFEDWLEDMHLLHEDDKTINWILDKYKELKNN